MVNDAVGHTALSWGVSGQCKMGVEFLKLLLDHGAVPMIHRGYIMPRLLFSHRLDQFEAIVSHPKCPVPDAVEALLVFGATRVDTGLQGERSLGF